METLLLLLSSGVIAAFVAQLYTRKNLKTSQYINVITSERIKWIQDVRNEFSVLLSSVFFIIQVDISHLIVISNFLSLK